MILLHRLIPFVVFAASAAGFGVAMMGTVHPLVPLVVSLVAVLILFSRLSGWAPRSGTFWNLVLAPVLFLGSAQGLFLLLETVPGRLGLAAIASLLVFFFAEQVFAYVHAPALYQPFAIQHLSLGMNLFTVFCAGAFAFGARVFLQTPFHVLMPLIAAVSGYAAFQTLWVSKMEPRRALLFGAAAGLAVGESFLGLALLPTGFYVNAAVLALVAYVFLGLSRASLLEQLSRALAVRYVAAGTILALAVFGTAAWH